MRSLRSVFFSFIAFIFALLITSLAQTTRGIIVGRAVDSAGAVLQGARVQLEPGGWVRNTDEQGEFVLTDMPPGTYTVTVGYLGFSTYSKIVLLARNPSSLASPARVKRITLVAGV